MWAIKFSWVSFREILSKTRIKTFFIVIFHDIKSELDRTIWNVCESSFWYIFEGVSPHIIYPFKLFILNEINFRSIKSNKFIVVLKQLIADRVLQNVGIQGVKIDKIVTLV